MERKRRGEESWDAHEPPSAHLCLWGLVTYLGVLGLQHHLSLPFVLEIGGNLWETERCHLSAAASQLQL